MKQLPLLIILLGLNVSWGCESNPVDILVVGDSQTGASWAKSYFGNFAQQCLGDSFAVYGRGGTSPSSWIGKGNLDHVETIMRSPVHQQLNLGSGDQVQLCQKRLLPMIEAHKPKKLMLFFGDNLIASSDEEIVSQVDKTMKTIEESGLAPNDCYFLTPTYEMEVATKRNVTRKNYDNTLRITLAIKKTINGRCQHLDGLELMRSSAYLTSNQLLKRVQIPGLPGCGGAAVNDNIHVCGEAAKDFANKVCALLK